MASASMTDYDAVAVQNCPPTGPTEEADVPFDSSNHIGGDDDPDDIPSEPFPSSRDLSNLEEFDWESVSHFANSPEEVEGLSPAERAALVCINIPGVTRVLWDSGIKPLVKAVVRQMYGYEVPDGDIPIQSHKVVLRRVQRVGVNPAFVDACQNHCCVFNGERNIADRCPHCDDPRLDSDGQPFLQTAIFPLKNMLRSILVHNQWGRTCVTYRKSFESDPDGRIRDFWDGAEPRRMMQPGGLLEDITTLALTVSGDAAEYSASPKRKIMPYIALIQNLPPHLRYRHEVPLAIHAGEPSDDSVWKAIFKFAEYSGYDEGRPCPLGLWYERNQFSYTFCLATGDYPFAASALGLVPHTGRASCRICTVAGYKADRSYYLVDKLPTNAPPPEKPKNPEKDDQKRPELPFTNIPHGHDDDCVRTFEGYYDAIRRKQAASVKDQRTLVQLETGVTVELGPTELVSKLPKSIPFHRLVPIDPMHAVPLNVCKHLLQFTTNHKKKYQDFPFCLAKSGIDEFIFDLLECTKMIPEELMRRPLVDFTKCSARSEHYLAIGRLAPILLVGRLDPCYVRTFALLSRVMDNMADVLTNNVEIEELDSDIREFQKSFYADWYGGDFARAPLCRTYFHAIAHIPDAIRAWGPPFVFAQWSMERFNGTVIGYARLNATTPVITSANKIATNFRVQQILGTKDPPAPRFGLGAKLREECSPFLHGEKQAIASFHNCVPDDVTLDEVPRFDGYLFETPDGQNHRAVGQRFAKANARCRHYVWCDRLDAFAKVDSIFEYAGEALAFVFLLERTKVQQNFAGLEFCYLHEWSKRVTVMRCEDFTQLVAFVRSSKSAIKMYLVKGMRVYSGEMHRSMNKTTE